MEGLAGFVILIFIIVVIFKMLERRVEVGKYKLKSGLFTSAERSFLGVLDQAVSEGYRVFAKVRVADLVEVQGGSSRSEWGRAFGKIQAKHFDFVVCRKSDLSVFCVLELDDASHSRKKRQRRDAFIDELCTSVGLRLVRIKAQRAYKLEDIRQLLAPLSTQSG